MVYNQYITKKRFKGVVLSSDINIPYRTICDVLEVAIYLSGRVICYIGSQTMIDYFFGYSSKNSEKEVERQNLIDELYGLSPKDDVSALQNKSSSWNLYGEIIECGFGMCQWSWKDKIFDLSLDRLNCLISCIKNGVMPQCIL